MATRVLVTNDDGIDGPGLRALVSSLAQQDLDVIVVAPNDDYSGAGTSVISQTNATFTEGQRKIGYEKRILAEAPEVEAYAIAAPPAMCTLLAMRGAFGERPELVASGINFGLNTGPATRHSGTVAAALTAAGFGVPSLAISAQYNFEDPDAEMRFDTAAAVAMQLLQVLPDSGHLVLNLNVPQCTLDDLAGVRAAAVSQVTGFYSYVQERSDTTLTIGYKVGEEPMPAGTDSALVAAGFAAVSSLVGVSSIDCSDVISRLSEAAA